jgi:hypothetical protein
MATFEKIAFTEVGSGGAADITFNTILANWTDLCVVASLRNTGAGGPYEGVVRFNGSTSGYTDKWIRGAGSGTPISANDSSTGIFDLFHPGAGATASTFGNLSIYVPNYTSASTYKSVSIDVVTEDNATLAYASLSAGLWSNNSAITSLSLVAWSGSFAQYSTATLYGIKKA